MTAVEPDLTAGTAVEAARHYRERGWRPFPLDHPSTPRCSGLHRPERPCEGGEKRGKHPAVAYGTAAASEAPDKLLEYWFGNGPRNIGIACGPSGLVVIDEDEPNALSMLAADLGEELPKTYRVRTARGWHWYFEAPTDVELGNRSGRLAEYHIDVRGGRGKGGYVVAAGSTHHTGHIYEAEDLYALPAPLPRWLIPEIQASPAGPAGATGDGQGAPGAWDDAPRYGAEHDLREQYRRHLDAVRSRNGEFRHELFNAARDAWRLHNLGLLDMPTMAEDLRQAVIRVWQNEPDGNDKLIVNEQARDAAAASPWVVLGPTSAPAGSSPAAGAVLAGEGGFKFPGLDLDPAQVAEINAEAAAMEEAARFDADVAYAARQADVREAANRMRAARDRPALSILDLDDFLDAPQPDYLVPGAFYTNSTAKVFGPPGGSKTFWLLDVALSLATGTAWRGHDLGQHRVHYIMAEGQGTNTARALAWFHHRGVDRAAGRGWFRAITEGVLLTPEGLAGYLDDVRADQPALIVLDTKNRMMVGEENSASDNAVLIRAMDELKRAAGGACVVLVDHTGVGDTTRGRGSNAVEAAMDTEIRCTYDDQAKIGTAQVTRDKASEPGKQWSYRIERVEYVPGIRPDTPTPAVPVSLDAAELVDRQPFGLGGEWWALDEAAVPEEITELSGKGKEAARDIFRLLRFVGGDRGLTADEIRSALKEGPRTHHRSTVHAAFGMLDRAGVTTVGATSARLVLDPRFDTA